MMLVSPRAASVLVFSSILTVPCLSVPARGQTRPAISINKVPPAGAGGPETVAEIAGVVRGIPARDVTNYHVLVYARADIWYIQPLAIAEEFNIPIDAKGRWETETHFGRQYAALLVRRGYRPPATTARLPEIGGPVLDRTIRSGGIESPKSRE